MKSVVIRGPGTLFPQLLAISGLDLDHAQAADIGDQHILSAYATDEAIDAMRLLGLTVEIKATEADEQARLAQFLADFREDDTGIA